ncbi:uncharacterized protein DUF4268 [Maribacter vaceletii]|uniref:Uncharacterized protein DUF4268 n=1 Tax=Maribacter vaceletii TaxID=1206816 RepID=A0A495DSV2_9FLAO|nr:DUF4268 domain-containing protein [Maribacter vaceletii]RKR07067.1 uncharacterized protein DUF4268 [Maribacter vaceletii]
MFSKEESKRLKQDFWIAFGKSFPRKWTLYNTKIKGLTFKFQFNLKTAEVAIIVDHNNLEVRMELWEKLISLKSIIKEEYLPNATFNDSYPINNKEISKIYVEIKNVSIHNKDTWQETMIFLSNNMKKVEAFFQEYKDILGV